MASNKAPVSPAMQLVKETTKLKGRKAQKTGIVYRTKSVTTGLGAVVKCIVHPSGSFQFSVAHEGVERDCVPLSKVNHYLEN